MDSCAIIPNPAQIDQDNNDIGDACDFGFGLAIGATFAGPMEVWTVGLASGVHQPTGIPSQLTGFDVSSSRDGWWAWASQAEIWLRDVAGGDDTFIGYGFTPDFMGESLVYVAPDRGSVQRLPRYRADESNPV